MIPSVLELSAVTKDYRGLRPLRIDQLAVAPGDQLAIVGLDRPAAEVFINLMTGATLPDRGDVYVLGRSTSAIKDSTEWLATVDRFGIVSDRAVLLEALSVVQNLAVPFSLDIEPPPEDVRARAVRLAREAGLDDGLWDRRVGDLDALARLRIRVARALALDPALLVLEHPTSGVGRSDVVPLGRHIRAIGEGRGLAVVTLTADQDFAELVATRVLILDPATGRLKERRRGWLRRS